MSEARIKLVDVDPWGAKAHLEQAKRLLGDGESGANSPEGRQILIHAAVISACDALLAINGRQVVGSDGGHRLRLETAAQILEGDQMDLFDRLDDARMDRNNVSYAAGMAFAETVESALAAGLELVGLIDEVVSTSLPPHLLDDQSGGPDVD